MKNRKKESFFSFFFTHPLFIFLWYSWYASQFIKKKRTALLHPCTSGAVRLTPSNRFARFPTEWQTLCSTKRFKQSHFRSEEFRAALFFPRFKYQLLSLCKSPSVHIAGCNYYTVSTSPRWDSNGATIDIVEKAVAASKLRSEETRASLLLRRFKFTTLSLCKSPNVQKAVTDYYTVTAPPRWGSYGATNAIFDQAVSASRLSIAVAREQHPFSIIQKPIHHPPSSLTTFNLLTSLHNTATFPNKYLPLSLQKTEKKQVDSAVSTFWSGDCKR